MDGTTSPPQPPHVVIVPSPGMGHLIPLTEFAKRLVPYGFTFTFALPTDGPPSGSTRAFLCDASASTSAAITTTFLPPVDLSDLPSTVRAETRICHLMSRSLSPLRDLLSDLTANNNRTRVKVLLVDLFGPDAFDVAREFHLIPYMLFPTTAMSLALLTNLEELDRTVSCEYRELTEPVKLPGCVPIHGRDLLDPIQDRTNEAYKWLLHLGQRYKLADGIIINTFDALECGALNALATAAADELGGDKGRILPPVHPVGPLVRHQKAGDEDDNDRDGNGSSTILKWLDQQPDGSVVFVSFGSGGALTGVQQNELALGIEMSGQRFVWVVRNPSDSAYATYFSLDGQRDPLESLPQGFLERVKGCGLAVPLWAPQMRILSHAATGGFMSHCGWNSTLESVVNGVALIAWPLYAEQKMNAVMLAEDMKVALRPVAGEEDGLVGRGEVARVVKELMTGEEGKRVRRKMVELKDAAVTALSEGGSSIKAMNEIAMKWKSL